MRSLKQYIMESVHYYDFTIKIVGELEAKTADLFKHNLSKFDPVELTGPTSTPIQKSPYGFPGVVNQPVNIIKGKFRYPFTEPMIRQMAQLMGLDENRVRLVNTEFDDGVTEEMEQFENSQDKSPLLTNEYPSDEKAKKAAESYGNSYLDEIAERAKDHQIKSPFAGKTEKVEFDPFKPEEYLKAIGANPTSPMTNVKLPPKPATGRG